MDRMIKRLLVVGIGVFLGFIIFFYQPSVSYATTCPPTPPWEYNITITIQTLPVIPYTASNGIHRWNTTTHPILNNSTKVPIYVIPTAVLTDNVKLEQMINHTDTLKLVDNKAYFLDQKTKLWTKSHNPGFIYHWFFSTLPIPSDSYGCPMEKPYTSQGAPPAPIHDHLTLIYNQEIIKVPVIMEYVENPNYEQEADAYFSWYNRYKFPFIITGCGVVLILFFSLFIVIRGVMYLSNGK